MWRVTRANRLSWHVKDAINRLTRLSTEGGLSASSHEVWRTFFGQLQDFLVWYKFKIGKISILKINEDRKFSNTIVTLCMKGYMIKVPLGIHFKSAVPLCWNGLHLGSNSNRCYGSCWLLGLAFHGTGMSQPNIVAKGRWAPRVSYSFYPMLSHILISNIWILTPKRASLCVCWSNSLEGFLSSLCNILLIPSMSSSVGSNAIGSIYLQFMLKVSNGRVVLILNIMVD